MKKAVTSQVKKASKLSAKRTASVIFSLLFILTVMFFDTSTAFSKGTDTLSAKTELENLQQIEMSKSYGKEYAQGEVIVKFKETQSEAAMQNTLNSFASSIEEEIRNDNLMLADVPEGETVESFIEELEEQTNVEYAQPNYIYRLEQTVNDPHAQLPNPDQWYLDKINAYEAWDTTMGSSGVTVAVLDSGVDIDHPDLVGQVNLYHKVVAGDNGIDDDKGHGTHVSGTIAAVTNNNIGVAGIAPNTDLIVVDVFKSEYIWDEEREEWGWEWGAYTSDIITGITYARANDADVINMSLGGYEYDPAFEAAINAAVGAGVVCIASAGNDGDNEDYPELRDANYYPSDYEACISVISTDQNDEKSGFSNYGPQKDISAPGGSSNVIAEEWILSTYVSIERDAFGNIETNTAGYAWVGGTSTASPVIAGVVALMLAANPYLTVADVKDILYSTAVDLGDPGRDDYFGYGRVDAQAAVLAAIVDVSGVTLNETTVDLTVGNIETLIESVVPANAANQNVTWSSSNENYVTVTDGVLTGQATGSATITVTTEDGSFTDACVVNVTNPAISVSLDESTMGLEFGASGSLTATVYPIDADNLNVSWDSSDEGVATVDASGNVDAVDYGTTTITVTTQEGGHTDTCEVTVIKHVDGVSLNLSTLLMLAGEEETLEATVSPIDATDKNVSWSSDDTGVATVDSSGKVSAVGKGTATITVTTDDGGFTDVCVVSVNYGDIRSDVYSVDQANSLLKDVALNTSAAAFKANIKNDSGNIKVYDIMGQEYIGDKIKTGMTVKFIVDSIVKDELKIVILGDSSGDGNISITDYTLVRLDILDLKSLSGEFWHASDINKDGKISITDYTLIRLHILDLKSIH